MSGQTNLPAVRQGNESRLKAAGIRMALKLLPGDMLQQAPAMLEKYLLNELKVGLFLGEVRTCYLMSEDKNDGCLRIALVTLDNNSQVKRVIKSFTLADLFKQILEGMKEI